MPNQMHAVTLLCSYEYVSFWQAYVLSHLDYSPPHLQLNPLTHDLLIFSEENIQG